VPKLTETPIAQSLHATNSILSAVAAVLLTHFSGLSRAVYGTLLQEHSGIELYYDAGSLFVILLALTLFGLAPIHTSKGVRFLYTLIIGYCVFVFACVVCAYFLDQPHFFHVAKNGSLISTTGDFIVAYFVIAPVMSFSWLTIAFSGGMFLLLERCTFAVCNRHSSI